MNRDSHPQSADPTVDPFAEPSPGQVVNLPADFPPDPPRSEVLLSVVLLLTLAVLVAVVLTAPARATALITPTPRPIVTPGCGPPTCVERTTTPTQTPEQTPTVTPPPTATRWPRPAWLDQNCLIIIQRIMQNELRGSVNHQAYRFMATQLLYRAIDNDRCVFPGWTSRANGDLPPIVSSNLNSVLSDLPLMNWPRCQYVVSWSGVQTLINQRYDKSLPVIIPGIETYGPRGSAIGVNCTQG